MGPDDLVLCSGTLPRQVTFAERLAAALGRRLRRRLAVGPRLRRRPGRGSAATPTCGRCSTTTAWRWPSSTRPGGGCRGRPTSTSTREHDTEDVFRFGEAELFAVADAVGARSVNAVDVFGGTWTVGRRRRGLRRAVRPGRRARTAGPHRVAPVVEDPRPGHGAGRSWRKAGAPNGGINVDAWHLVRSGTDLADLAVVPGELILGIQLDDGPAAAEDNLVEATLHHRALPGEGEFDLAGLIADAGRHRDHRPDRGRGVLRRAPVPARPTRPRLLAARGHPGRPGRGPMTGVVVVGTGFGCVTHVRALRAAGFEVVALVGRDPDKTAERAACSTSPWPSPRWTRPSASTAWTR